MSNYNLCIIDDKIPVGQYLNKIEVTETSIIDKNILLNYVKFADEIAWADTNLYNLIKRLIVQTDLEFDIYGFISHSFYLNYINENIYSPDVVIFDWDIGISDKSSNESLKEILEKTYCLIAIYTEYDKREEIDAIIQGKDFKVFKYRLFIIEKSKENSHLIIIEEIKNHLDDFTYKYGKDFKYKITTAINTSFSKIGSLSFNQFIKIFGDYDKNEKTYKISSLNFIEIMNEQIKSHLISSNTIQTLKASDSEENKLTEKKLWHFRMFHEPQDDIVRKGDIVWHKIENIYYFIITSDCYLSHFWSKNLGFLTIIPLYNTNNEDIIKKIKEYVHPDSIKQFKISSLVNPQIVTSITIIPYLDKENDYFFMPKEIKSISITKPENREYLKYDDIHEFDPKRRFRLNEPFLSSLVEFAIRNITDIGVPDYSSSISNSLKETLK